MAQVNINPNELRNLAVQLHQVAAEQEVLTQKTRSITSHLETAWHGNPKSDLVKQLQSLMNDERKKVELLNYLAKYVTEVADAYTCAESDLASLASKLVR
ncbi:MAG: hypothetical protein FWG90_02795 [Oscillospiraceae bacterium]|nr:hypothetical protein [Oscillospiraceae bacterium]